MNDPLQDPTSRVDERNDGAWAFAKAILICLVLISFSCRDNCDHRNTFPSTEFQCEVSGDAAALEHFFYLADSTSLFPKVTVVIGRDLFDSVDLISIYNQDRSLADYRIVSMEQDHILIESYYYVPPMFSWRPPFLQYTLMVCADELRVYEDDSIAFEHKSPVLLFSIDR